MALLRRQHEEDEEVDRAEGEEILRARHKCWRLGYRQNAYRLGQTSGEKGWLGTEDLRARDFRARDLKARDLKAQDLKAQDLKAQDLKAQDLKAQDLKAQDLKAQDLKARGLRAPGESAKP
jgi:hypothetical protein